MTHRARNHDTDKTTFSMSGTFVNVASTVFSEMYARGLGEFANVMFLGSQRILRDDCSIFETFVDVTSTVLTEGPRVVYGVVLRNTRNCCRKHQLLIGWNASIEKLGFISQFIKNLGYQ